MAVVLLSFLLTFDGLTAFPNKQQMKTSCENCTTTVVSHNSSEISSKPSRLSTINEPTDGPTLLVVLEEDSSSGSSEEIIIGELIEEENNTTLTSSEEVIDPQKIKSLTIFE